MASTLPVEGITLPSDLGGTTNGKLDASLLVDMKLSPWGSKTRMHHIAARVFKALFAEVKERFGVTLTCTSIADCYRSYEQQEATFRIRYTTTVLPGRPTKKWNGQTWYQRPNTAMAATPGTSNHGWALAMDVAILTALGEVVGITGNQAMWTWLLDNADDYGCSWEAQSEPWHIRYNKGDQVPAAVLAYENPVIPPPEEDDVSAVVLAASDGTDQASAFAWSNAGIMWVPNAEARDLGYASGQYQRNPADPDGYYRMSRQKLQFLINAQYKGTQLPPGWDTPPRQ